MFSVARATSRYEMTPPALEHATTICYVDAEIGTAATIKQEYSRPSSRALYASQRNFMPAVHGSSAADVMAFVD